MVDIPEELCNNTFDEILKKGSVLKTKFLCHDGELKTHYHIILNFDHTEENLLYVISTSQLNFYDNNPRFNNDIVRISANKLDFLPKESILDCRRVRSVERDIFKKRYSNNILEFVGVMPSDILQQIDNAILRTRFVPRNTKRRILPPIAI